MSFIIRKRLHAAVMSRLFTFDNLEQFQIIKLMYLKPK